MVQIGSLFKNFTEKDIKETFKERTRKDVIDEFYDIMRKHALEGQIEAKERQYATGIRQKIWPVPRYMAISSKLDGLRTVSELEWYLGYCKEAKNFSKCFYFNLKAKEPANVPPDRIALSSHL